MKVFLNKFIKVIAEAEKKFDLNSKRMQDLNKLLYEYENISLESYSPSMNQYEGKIKKNTQSKSEQALLLLFENPNNIEIKKEFDKVMAEVLNPFIKMRLWLEYEILEIEAL